MIVGNDVSKWQGDINYDTYRNNANFVILKVSEGTGLIDPKFLRNQSEARRVGLPIGYYHFARPDLFNKPEAEADYFLKAIGGLREGELLCLDYEPKSNPFNTVDWCLAFLNRVSNMTGCKPFIYLSQSQVRSFDWGPVVSAKYDLWLAAYVPTEKAYTGQWGRMIMQQWTSSQAVPGISGNVDGDWFFGDVVDFKRFGYQKPPQATASPSSSVSPSASTSPSKSPSASSSPSVSPSLSVSSSPSSSPSPSEEPCDDYEYYKGIVMKTCEVLNKKWTWLGKNGWKNRLAELENIYHNV